jgi:preprotein translocase subunit SecA
MFAPAGVGDLESNAPYAERGAHFPGRMDRTILHAWGVIAPRVLPKLAQRGLIGLVQRADNYSAQVSTMSDQALRQTADDLRTKLVLDPYDKEALARSFALTREAAGRHLGKRHYLVQMLGGAVMMRGAIAEMQTGEGKTLTALLPAVAAALSNRPAHIITVNEYLARRDAEQLRPVYKALGLTVGLVEAGQGPQERRAAYSCDITYCTNKDLVFDYLRDRMALNGRLARTRLLLDELFNQTDAGGPSLLIRGLQFAIVDEADSVLIDEARTPLILAGADHRSEPDNKIYSKALEIAGELKSGEDFQLLPDENAVSLTKQGESKLSAIVDGHEGLWSIRRARNELIHQALSALHLFRKDVHYILAGGKIQIVDEFTGRVMPDRSWERGLHQMIEAKEGCEITEQRRTLARITYQRFFRRYLHVCGMTGTALEAAGELRAVYDLEVVRIPTNRPLQRRNWGTRLFRASDQKWEAVAQSVQKHVLKNRAILVGTRSVAASDTVTALLSKAGIDAVVLNARQDQEEAEIVSRAGQPGRVTVATNMAGRGTDIQLHKTVQEAGGLHVILTEYHESSRIDRQLFGRAGRQGDPGSFECIVCLSDDLFVRFANESVARLFRSFLCKANIISKMCCELLRLFCQASAERLHLRIRRQALLEDERFQKALSFASKTE